MRGLLLCAATLSFACAVGAASAADITAQSLNDGSALISVSGKFVRNNVQQFTDVIAPFNKGTVVFASPGGSLDTGLQIGTLIRLRNFSTAVAPGDVCASSCALAWLGGTVHYIGEGAKVGFHAAYYTTPTGEPMETGAGNALVGAYLNCLGLSDRAVVYITQADPNEITWLTASDANQIGVDFEPMPSSQIAGKQAPAPTPSLQPPAPNPVQTGAQIGPSYDCNKALIPVQQLICTSPVLAKADLEYVQPYYVLRQIVGSTGWKHLMVEAINVQKVMAENCGIDPTTGALATDRNSLVNCLADQYGKQRSVWLSRLSGAGYQEANRPIERHIALQTKLQALGFIPSADRIDGVYGTGTRSAIMSWQTSVGLPATGLLGDADAARLLATTRNPNAPVATSTVTDPFVCPESLPNDTARINALAQYMHWLQVAHPELNTETKIKAFRYEQLVAHHCDQTVAKIQQHSTATVDEAMIQQLADLFRRDYNAGGISLVAQESQKCYINEGNHMTALRICMLYDTAGFILDASMQRYMHSQGV